MTVISSNVSMEGSVWIDSMDMSVTVQRDSLASNARPQTATVALHAATGGSALKQMEGTSVCALEDTLEHRANYKLPLKTVPSTRAGTEENVLHLGQGTFATAGKDSLERTAKRLMTEQTWTSTAVQLLLQTEVQNLSRSSHQRSVDDMESVCRK